MDIWVIKQASDKIRKKSVNSEMDGKKAKYIIWYRKQLFKSLNISKILVDDITAKTDHMYYHAEAFV